MKRLIVVLFCLMACGLGAGPKAVFAQPYPNRPIQLIVGNVAGAQSDISARLLAQEMEKHLGGKIMVMNKPGASGIVGTDALVRSKKDGYTLAYMSSNSLVYVRIMNPEAVPYDPEKQLEPLGLHQFFPSVIVVQTSSPWKSFTELVEYARKNPGKIRVGTVGQGAAESFNLEVIQSSTGTQFTQVPFEGGETVTTALLGGHIEGAADVFSKFLPHVNAGRLRYLLLTKKRADFPDVPTFTELGYKQDLFSVWLGLFAPAGLPEDVKRPLIQAFEKAVKNPELKAKIENMGNVVDYKSPAEVKKLMMEDYEKALAVAKKVGLRK